MNMPVFFEVATRAFLRPSKFLFEKHLRPTTNWRSIRHMWSAFAKRTPVVDFWLPVPGIYSNWNIKLTFIVDCYIKSGLLSYRNDEVNHLYIKIGIDGTNMWKAQLETITLSFAHLEATDSCHLLLLYMGKENFTNLKSIFTSYDLNHIPLDYEFVIGSINFVAHFYIYL